MKKTIIDYIYDLYNILGLIIILLIIGSFIIGIPFYSFQQKVNTFNKCTGSNISYSDAIWADLKVNSCNN